MNAIELHRVRLALGEHVVLNDVSIEIGPHEFIGVLGPNGSGKTTLMRAILGLVPPSQGTVTVLGVPATHGNRDVGYMPQLHSALPATRLRGWDVVGTVVDGYRLGLPILNRAERGEIDRALDMVSARELARRPLSELSGGERQRLLLAQTLIGNPQLLLLDEPLVSLDPHHQDEVVQLVKALQTQLQIAVLFSAHELNPILDAIDRVLYLGNGQAELGTVDDVITGPVLSRLYGSEIEVVHVDSRIFVMSGGHHMEEHHTGPHPSHA